MTVHKALFVMSSQSHLTLKDGSQHPTGFYASEFVEPYEAFQASGMQIEVATPDGTRPQADPLSLNPAYVGAREAHHLAESLEQAAELRSPCRLQDVKASDYDLVFVPGGHAPMEDLPRDPALQGLLFQAAQNGTPVAALCHGPAALLAAGGPQDGVSSSSGQGPWLYAGKALTSFSQAEENLTPLAGKLKFELEPALRERGAYYTRSQASQPFEGYVVQDGNLLTGENPNSAGLLSQKALQLLHGEAPSQSLSFSVHRDLKACPDEVWAAIGRFDTLPWHPGIESGTVETRSGVTERKLVARGGGTVFTEQLLESGPRFLRYQMTDGLPAHPVATLRVEPTDQGGSRVFWEADMDTSHLDAAAAEGLTKGVTGFYEAGLDSLQKRFG